ncbi:MAG: MBL fold metallo-hydrolase, partial [Bacteroidia bacterium]
MKIEQIYTGCLSHAAYYIENGGEAAIFDPLREVQPYIDRASKDNAKIKYVFETHFHADFVSGHLDLAKKTGAQIVFGPTAKPAYEAIVAEDGQLFHIGKYRVKVIHTPGHTMESTSYLLIDQHGNEHGIITGDTLFIGDVGRPDLAQHVSAELTREKLAGYLYDSLRTKIMPLSDHLIVYPNHGAGSACGKHMSKDTTDTLGHQKKVNYALNPALTKEQFVKEVLNGLVSPPRYFPQDVLLNMKGYDSIDKVLGRGTKALPPSEFEMTAAGGDVVVIDTRDPVVFAGGFVYNSINIGINGNFATWAGTLLPDIKQPLLIVAEKGKEAEVVTRLARVGYDHAMGYLSGGMDAWKKAGKETDTIACIDPEDLYRLSKK